MVGPDYFRIADNSSRIVRIGSVTLRSVCSALLSRFQATFQPYLFDGSRELLQVGQLPSPRNIRSSLWRKRSQILWSASPFMTLGVMQRGYSSVSTVVSDAVAICGLLIIVWARLSLGRNICFVPAQREIVTSGAYRYARHPIYTGAFVGFFGMALRAYSPRNVVLLGLGTFWFLIKSIVEENLLRADPQYAAYLQKVRARWIPFVV